MLQRFQEHTGLTFPFLREKKLIVAVSGGADSVVLVHLLYRSGYGIALAHCNFKLRSAESDDDEVFVKTFAKKLDVAVYTRSFDTRACTENRNLSIQMAARELRYQWFATLLNSMAYDYVLTAHHADDNLETFLINLSRGSGLDGLTGIPAQNGRILRPLLPFSKADILDYARKNRLAWREDSSNAQTKYLRNAIRHRIIPELKTLHPAFLQNVRKTMAHLSGSKALLQQHTAALRTALFRETPDGYKISVEKLAALNPQKPWLYELFKDFGFTERDDVARLLDASSGKQLFSATHRLLKDRDDLCLEPLPEQVDVSEFVIDAHTKKITSPVTLIINETDRIGDTAPHSIYVDKEKLKFPLTLRKWKKGDYFYPFGMQGKKKLSKFFKDEKYSLWAKENQWLLCSGDNIVWIVGRRADNRYRVDNTTGTILNITVQQ